MRGPLRAEDALFLHAQTPLACQQVGAVVLLEAARPANPKLLSCYDIKPVRPGSSGPA